MGKLAAPVRADKEMMFTNRQLVALMWPLLLEQLLAITVGLADSLMVATVGDAAISAVSLVDSISNLMIYIFSAMATGGAAVAGQYIGQRQKEDACNAGQQLIALLGAVSIFFVALLYLFRTQILTVMFGHIEPDVMAATNTYYLYVMASIPGIALYNGGAALFRTMGHSDVSLKVSLLMNSINVIGNAVLIFGFGMDVAGVAIPTLVSRTVAAVVILSLLFNRDSDAAPVRYSRLPPQYAPDEEHLLHRRAERRRKRHVPAGTPRALQPDLDVRYGVDGGERHRQHHRKLQLLCRSGHQLGPCRGREPVRRRGRI